MLLSRFRRINARGVAQPCGDINFGAGHWKPTLLGTLSVTSGGETETYNVIEGAVVLLVMGGGGVNPGSSGYTSTAYLKITEPGYSESEAGTSASIEVSYVATSKVFMYIPTSEKITVSWSFHAGDASGSAYSHVKIYQ